MNVFRVYIGWDSRFPEPAHVLAHTLREQSSKPLDIRFLDLRHLKDCYGFDPAPDAAATTEFTRSRFLVPYLCGYDGMALFLDNDVLCLSDPIPLFETIDHSTKSLFVVQHDYQPVDGSLKMSGVIQTAYPRKNWSSVMAMNCRYLSCWTLELVARGAPRQLHRFEDIDDHHIGDLPDMWNQLDEKKYDAGFLHFTSGGPWSDLTKVWPHQELWFEARRRWLIESGRDPDTPVLSQKS